MLLAAYSSHCASSQWHCSPTRTIRLRFIGLPSRREILKAIFQIMSKHGLLDTSYYMKVLSVKLNDYTFYILGYEHDRVEDLLDCVVETENKRPASSLNFSQYKLGVEFKSCSMSLTKVRLFKVTFHSIMYGMIGRQVADGQDRTRKVVALTFAAVVCFIGTEH